MTTGVFSVVAGPRSWFPLAGYSGKQVTVCHASTDLEPVGCDHGVRKEAKPMLDIVLVVATILLIPPIYLVLYTNVFRGSSNLFRLKNLIGF